MIDLIMSTPERRTRVQAGTRPCPACTGRELIPIHSHRFAKIEGVSIHAGYEVVACASCGLCFADGIPEQSTFDRYYREASKYEGGGSGGSLPESTLQRFREEAADIVRHAPAKDASILEIGCATGALLAMLKEQGYSRLSGLDPSPSCAVTARELHGLHVDTGDLSAGLAGKHGMIVMIAVLEHIRDLTGALRTLAASLEDGGVLFVEVPDAMRFERAFDAPFQEFSVEHINYFSCASLSALLERNGFRALEVVQRDRAESNGKVAPVIAGAFRKLAPSEAASAKTPATHDDAPTRDAIARYVALSERRDRVLRDFLRAQLPSHDRVIVWGCGTLTLRMVANGELPAARVAAFVDGNRRYWGRTIEGVTILEPEAVRGRSETILVSSVGQGPAIEAGIRAKLAYQKPILTYPVA
ncbi:MAG TPA: class I SAM-dependent methyltransferase [Polyangiales bacterium]|jgi:SAM-dependent methyltransferase|nr:class I SAM-dependent methyltransferase [Polyangiales bacterium]